MPTEPKASAAYQFFVSLEDEFLEAEVRRPAEAFQREFEKCARKLRREGSLTAAARARMRQGQAALATGNPKEALRLMRLATRTFREGGQSTEECIRPLAETASLLRGLGRYREARDAFEVCMNHDKQLSLPNRAGLHMNYAHLLFELGHYRAAVGEIKRSEKLFVDAEEDSGAGMALLSLGSAYLHLGFAAKAIHAYKGALDRFVSCSDSTGESWTRELIAVTAVRCGRGSKRDVNTQMNKAIRMQRKLGRMADLSRVLINYSYCMRHFGDYRKARALGREAREVAANLDDQNIQARVQIESAWIELEAARTDTWKKAERYLRALPVRTSSDVQVESHILRAEVLRRQTVGWKQVGAEIEKALVLVEKRSDWELFSQLGHRDGWREEQYSRTIDIARRAGKFSVAGALIRVAKAAGENLTGLGTDQKQKRRAKLSTASVSRGQAYLSYWISDHNLFIYAVSTRHEEFVRIDSKRVLDLVDRFNEEIALCESDAAVAYLSARKKALTILGKALYREVVEPVASVVEDNSVDEILISPSGTLYRISFPFVFAVGQQRSDKRILLVAEGVRGPSPSASRAPRSASVILGNDRGLNHVEAELSALKEIFRQAGIAYKVERGAASFLRALNTNDIVYYIGHAASRLERPPLSYLDFGKSQLFASAIAKQRSSRKPVVILSSCLGGDEGGGVGLSSALIGAGASKVISSLWRVDDHRASEAGPALLRRHLDSTRNVLSVADHPFRSHGFVATVPFRG